MTHDLTKYHGLGNDYLVVERDELGFELTPARIQLLCDRHLGVGSDGLLVPDDPPNWCGLRIFNPDGSEAEKSGNGIRIYAKWLRDTCRAAEPEFTIRTHGGDVSVRVETDAAGITQVSADMGQPRFRDDLATLRIADEQLDVVALSMGNPHCVVLRRDASVDDLRRLGPSIENHPMFPARTNVQLAWPVSRTRVQVLIWERGAGETQASGSSACAVAAACQHLGLVDRHLMVSMPGGELSITIDDANQVWMCGPAEEVARIELSPELVARLRALG
jgi:diaminopimelate epimerase